MRGGCQPGGGARPGKAPPLAPLGPLPAQQPQGEGVIKVEGGYGKPPLPAPFLLLPTHDWGSLSLHQGFLYAMDPPSECFRIQHNIHRIIKETRYIEVWLYKH